MSPSPMIRFLALPATCTALLLVPSPTPAQQPARTPGDTAVRAPGADSARSPRSPEEPLLQEDTVRTGTARTVVSGERLRRSGETDVIAALSGRVAGVHVLYSGGEAGASTAIRIRGARTFAGAAEPLVVVDGQPVSSATFSTSYGVNGEGGGSPLGGVVGTGRGSDINPDDIETIEILRGPAATSLYGARVGTGGVVLITTRPGRPGRTRYSLRSSLHLDRAARTLPLQRSYGLGFRGRSPACVPGGAVNCSVPDLFSWGPRLAEGIPTHDHVGELFETGRTLDNTLAVSGGTGRTTFYLSGGAVHQDGFFTGESDAYRRHTLRLNGTHRLREDLVLGTSLSLARTQAELVRRGNSFASVLLGGLRTPPDFDNREYLTAGGLHRSFRFPNPGPGSELLNRGFDNPFYALLEGENTQQVGRVLGNVRAAWRPRGSLRVDWALGVDAYADERLEGRPLQSSGSPPGGSVLERRFTERLIVHDLSVSADYALGASLSGSITAGQSFQERRLRQATEFGRPLVLPEPLRLRNTATQTSLPDYVERLRLEGYSLWGTLDFAGQLSLLGSLRYDGVLAPGGDGERAWSPRVGAAWNPGGAFDLPESVFRSVRLRAAYGVGARVPTSYMLQDLRPAPPLVDRAPAPAAQPAPGAGVGFRSPGVAVAAHARLERVSEGEAGADLGFTGGIADLSVTYYSSRAGDVALSRLETPLGEISNRGWEVTLGLRPYTHGVVDVGIDLHWARNRNRVENLGDPSISILPYPIAAASFAGSGTFAEVGQPLGVFHGFDFARCGRGLRTITSAGIVHDVERACAGQPDGALYIGPGGFPVPDPNERVIGDPNPDWSGGVEARIRVRGIRVGVLVETRQGGEALNLTRASLYQFGTHGDTEDRDRRATFGSDWAPGPVVGPGVGRQVAIGEEWFTGLGGILGPRAQFVEDASLTRLREVSLAYTVEGSWVGRTLGLAGIDVRVAGRNLWTWTDYTGFDPEPAVGGAAFPNRGIDWFVGPLSRALVLSVSLNR
ncbi:MAG TPA: TonB-dependent receptor plug domain-containing protein [Longimicrobiaceae bacterium]|nr:TonB-dependent receptor plug domain-containing protein [Longimicrobiaceae bacterium]